MITESMMEALLDCEHQHPDVEPKYGPEPSLRAMILNYYMPHFRDEAILAELVDTYCRRLTDYAVLEL